MKNHRAGLLAAVLAGIGGAAFADAVAPTRPFYREPPTPSQEKRWRDQRGYPQTGSGKRQGERVARQVSRALGDPFAASNRCIERIKARLAATV